MRIAIVGSLSCHLKGKGVVWLRILARCFRYDTRGSFSSTVDVAAGRCEKRYRAETSPTKITFRQLQQEYQVDHGLRLS